MPYLNWLKDDDLEKAVAHIITISQKAQKDSEIKFYRNVIDPFSALFQISGFEMDSSAWLVSEKTRQAQKTLQNHIGDFHQKILGHVGDWDNLGIGGNLDLKCTSRKILAEVKNKYNTVTGGSLIDVYNNLEGLVMPNSSIYNGYTAYFVQVIPKKTTRYDYPFTPSNRKTSSKAHSNPLIRIIDGASFYTMVTGEDNALEDLFKALPEVVKNVTGRDWTNEDLKILNSFFKQAYSA